LAGSLGRNASRQVTSAALFEMGRVFFTAADGKPGEEERVSLGMMGPFGRAEIDRRRAVSNEEALLWLKGAVENLTASLHAGSLSFVRCEHPAMEPGWAVDVVLNGERIGCMGLLLASLRHQWRMTSPMPLAELRLAPLLSGVSTVAAIKPVPQYPSVRRDIAFVADVSITHCDIESTIRKAAPKELTGIGLFDIFQSKEIGKGKRSMAYTLEFRSTDRTLTDQEVNVAFSGIIQALKDGLKVEVREG